MMRTPLYFLCLFLSALSMPALASDSAKEHVWAEQIKEQLIVGQALELKADKQSFFAIHTPAEGKLKRGGVILLHGLGAHPDWPDVISPLRKSLPESGWATLSIQLPVRPNSATFEDYPPLFPAAIARISAAIQHLQQQGLDSDDYQLALWRKLLQPVAIGSLVLVAISFIFGPLREGTMGFRIFAGVLVGIVFRTSQDLLGPASLVFGFSPIYAALAPIVICLLAGFFLLSRAR